MNDMLADAYLDAVTYATRTPRTASELLADTEWQTNPLGFLTEVLGISRDSLAWSEHPAYASHVWDGTQDPLVAICRNLAAGYDVGVESATGTGKTFLAGGIALWFLVSFPDALVVTTAPIENQLTLQLWKEIGRHWERFHERYPQATTVQLRVRMRPPTGADKETWAIIGYACGVDAASESAVRAQGFHAQHMLIITEETPGIDGAIMTAIGNTCTGDHNLRLALGNPDSRDDTLHGFCTTPGVVHIRISALDHPNVVLGRDLIPGAVSRRGLERLAAKWGADTPMYNSRARGISPPQAAMALIKREWCDAAVERYELWQHLPGARRALGVDVAQSLNGDKAAIARWSGPCLLEVDSFQCPNATQLARDVHAEMGRDTVEARYVGVDPVGVGAATVNTLNELTSYRINALSGGNKPAAFSARADAGYWSSWMPDANAFNNLRSQMWWQMREDLRLGRCALPKDERLIRQLTTPTFRVHNGKTVVESKETIRERSQGQSPDEADAVVYGNWVRYRETEKPPEVFELEGAFCAEALLAEFERRRVGRPKPPATPEMKPVDAQFGIF